jgi:eukaryotic-like serine/threonine-protein kinase
LTLTSGTHLGPYEITAPLGVGGMGEVYRATDTNLKRQVAIKVLPASVAVDAERLARFQREAEVLAALNHPNIAHIHGLEKTDGTVALVMELVEGEDLSQRIARGRIPLGRPVRWSADSSKFYYTDGDSIAAIDIKPGGPMLTSRRVLVDLPGDWRGRVDVMPNGERAVLIRGGLIYSDIVVVHGALSGASER